MLLARKSLSLSSKNRRLCLSLFRLIRRNQPTLAVDLRARFRMNRFFKVLFTATTAVVLSVTAAVAAEEDLIVQA